MTRYISTAVRPLSSCSASAPGCPIPTPRQLQAYPKRKCRRKHGKKVTIVEEGSEVGEGIPPILVRPQLVDWLDRKETAMIKGAKSEAVTDKGLVVTLKGGERKIIEADTVVTALPLQSDTALFESLKGASTHVYVIGDARQPGLIIDAIADGSRVAREI